MDLRVQAHGEHVLAGRDVLGRGEVEVVAHAGVVTRGQVLGFGGESVTAAHGNTLRARRRRTKRWAASNEGWSRLAEVYKMAVRLPYRVAEPIYQTIRHGLS